MWQGNESGDDMARMVVEALDALVALIAAGWEFSDAAYKVARMYGIEQSELEQAYDNRP